MSQLFYYGFRDGIQISLLTLITSIFLDITSFYYLVELFKKEGGILLYLESLILNHSEILFLI